MKSFDLRSKGAGAKAASASVLTGTTGIVATIPSGLKAPITVTRESGSAAITFAASGNRITAAIASALATGSSLSAIARAVQADGAGVLIPLTLTGMAATATLSALTLSSSAANVGTSATINIIGATAGSTITGAVPDGMTLNSSARTITGTPTVAGTFNFTLTETFAGAANSPRVSNVSVVVSAAAPTLSALSLASTTIAENTGAGTLVGAILGRTAGSTLSLFDNAGNRFALSGTNINAGAVGTNFETATSHNITIRETLAGYSNSPRDTVVTINVTNVNEQPNLVALTLSTSSATVGTSATINVVGATAGSTLAGTVPDGMTLNSAARTISGAPTSAGTFNFSLTETLGDSANSPRVSNVAVTVTSAGLTAFANQAETITIVNAMTARGATPSAGRVYQLDRLVRRLKASGVWGLAAANPAYSRLFVFATETAGTAELINLFNPGAGDPIIVGTPTFTPLEGYSATAAGNYIRTGVTLADVAQNDHHVALFAASAVSTNFADFGAINASSQGLMINPRTASSSTQVRSFGSVISPTGAAFGGGNFQTFINRTSSTAFDAGRLGRTVAAGLASASVAITSALELTLLNMNNNGTFAAGSGRIISGLLMCPGLTTSQRLEAYAAIQAYLDCVEYGEPVIHEAGYLPATVTVDAVFLGLTTASIVGAYRAKRRGLNAIIVGGERDRTVDHLGGVVSNGLAWTDSYDFTSIGGVSRAIYTWCNALLARTDSSNQVGMSVPSRIFNFAMRRMLDPTRTGNLPGMDVPIYLAEKVATASYSAGTGLYTITTGDGRTFVCQSFCDNTDSQESFDALSIPYKTGSEPRGTGLEAENGFPGPAKWYLPTRTSEGANEAARTPIRIDPYVVPGNPASGLLPGVITPRAIADGAADPTTQAICFRMPFTTDNVTAAPWPTTPPPDYDPMNYEFLGRLLATSPSWINTDLFKVDPVPLPNYDFNTNAKILLVGLDRPGVGTEWVNAQSGTKADREAVIKKVENQIRGLFYWILSSNDPRIPAAMKTSAQNARLVANAFLNPGPGDDISWGGFPYIRQCKRLVNSYNMNGADFTALTGSAPRSNKTIAVASYAADDHAHDVVAYDDGAGPALWFSGGYYVNYAAQNSVASRRPVPVEAVITDPSVPTGAGFSTATGPASTAVAYSVLRMEPTRWEIGEAQGEMAALRKETGQSFHALNYTTLRARILGGGDAVAPVLPQTNGQ